MHTTTNKPHQLAETTASIRIRRLCIWAQATALLGIVIMIVSSAMLPWHPDLLDQALREEVALGDEVPLAITPTTRAIAYLLMISITGIFIFALWTAFRLFSGYARGEIFTELAASRLSRLGWAIVAMAPASIVVDGLSTIVLTVNNPPGQRQFSLNLDATDFIAIVAGLVLVSAGRIMREATRVAEENRQFV